MIEYLRPITGPMVVWVVGIAICVCNAIFPRRMWGLFKSWKYKNPEMVEPSDLVVAWYRITGVLGAVVLGALLVFALLTGRNRVRCEETLSELNRMYEQGGIAAVERRAGELGLEVEEAEQVGVAARTLRIADSDTGERVGTVRPADVPEPICCGTRCR